jgi:NAD(P)-dependent dehydrogenase (short-subunit alcohol dehydrogenase family)
VREAGASVEYHSIDVRDEGALGALVADVYERHGRLDGVIHAAGVLDDKLVRDKSPESFAAVFDTKVAGARALEAALRPDVSFVVYFGSIAGVFGNRGQVDYAAANAALDLSAQVLARRLPGRVVSVDWGPWAGTGMVSPELEREYARRGIGLIEAHDGVARLLDEIESGCADPQVVVMRSTPEHLGGRVTAIDLRPGEPTDGASAVVPAASGRSV